MRRTTLSSGIVWLLKAKLSSKYLLSLFLLGLVTVGWGIGKSYFGVEIQIVVRFFYFLQVSIFAFATSWMLFPQTDMWLTQMLNPSEKSLKKLLLGRVSIISIGSVIFLSALITGGKDVDSSARLYTLIDVLIFSTGISVFSAANFLSIGSKSQLWQEGRKGRAFINYMKEAGSGGAGVPAGAVPTILATSLVAILGMLSVVFQAWIQGVIGVNVPGIAGAVLLVPGLYTWIKYSKAIDAEFYHSHGFYNELFRNPGGKADGGREPIPIESLYWVPTNIRPATWLTFRQLDRKFPLGRFLVLVFLVYWGLIKATVIDIQAIVLIPIIVILGKNMILFLIERAPYSSLWYRRVIGSDWRWIGVHMATGIRWLVPVQFFLLLTVWFVSDLNQKDFLIWLYFDICSIIVIAIGRSVFTTFSYAKNYR